MALLPRKKSQARLWASVNQQGSVSPSAVMLIYTWYALVLYLLTQSTNDHSAPSQALAMLTHPLHLWKQGANESSRLLLSIYAGLTTGIFLSVNNKPELFHSWVCVCNSPAVPCGLALWGSALLKVLNTKYFYVSKRIQFQWLKSWSQVRSNSSLMQKRTQLQKAICFKNTCWISVQGKHDWKGSSDWEGEGRSSAGLSQCRLTKISEATLILSRQKGLGFPFWWPARTWKILVGKEGTLEVAMCLKLGVHQWPFIVFLIIVLYVLLVNSFFLGGKGREDCAAKTFSPFPPIPLISSPPQALLLLLFPVALPSRMICFIKLTVPSLCST